MTIRLFLYHFHLQEFFFYLFFFFTLLVFEPVAYCNNILQVTFTEEHVSFLHFLTNVCAIVGGRYGSSIIPLHSYIAWFEYKNIISIVWSWHCHSCCLLHIGIFTISGILDSFIYHSQRTIKKKMELGKVNWWVLFV